MTVYCVKSLTFGSLYFSLRWTLRHALSAFFCVNAASLSILKVKEDDKWSEDLRPLAAPAPCSEEQTLGHTLWVFSCIPRRLPLRLELHAHDWVQTWLPKDTSVLRTSLWRSVGEAGDLSAGELTSLCPSHPPGGTGLRVTWGASCPSASRREAMFSKSFCFLFYYTF